LMSEPTGRIWSVLSGLDPAPAELECAELQLAAAKAMLSFRVLLHVTTNRAHSPVPEVTVTGAGFDAAGRPVTVVGDEAGWVLTPPLRRGREHLLAIHEGRNYRAMTVYAETVAPVQVHQVRFGAAPKGAVQDRPGDPVRFYSGSEVWVANAVTALKGLAAGTALLVGTADESGRDRLTGAQRKYRAGIVTVPALNLAADKLPARTKVGDLVVVTEDHALRRVTATERRKVLSARGPLRGMREAVR